MGNGNVAINKFKIVEIMQHIYISSTYVNIVFMNFNSQNS